MSLTTSPKRDEEGAIDIDIDAEELAQKLQKAEEEEDNDPGHADRYGFLVSDQLHHQLSLTEKEIKSRKTKEAERTKKWIEMMKLWHKYTGVRKQEKLKDRIRKGIPDAVRSFAWYRIARSQITDLKALPDIFSLDYSQLDATTSDEIDRDIDRTFPRHIMFMQDNGSGQESLRRILRAYSLLDRDVGYCQGMGFIAALLLTYLIEEEAFLVFYMVLQRPSAPLRLLYLPKLIETQKILHVFACLGKQHLSSLWSHLEEENVHPTMYFTEWIMTMFCRGFSFDLVTRVWDIFLFEGNIKVVYRVSLALLKSCKKQILTLKFDKILPLLRELPALVDANAVMELAWKIPLKRAHIEEHERKYAESLPARK